MSIKLKSHEFTIKINRFFLSYFEWNNPMLSSENIQETFFQSPPLENSKLAWWVEIKTTTPRCTYYFGPFASAKEAHLSHYGYVEDLMGEKAHGIGVEIKQLQPRSLTIEED